MKTISIEICLDFNASHRIPGHKGKCKYLHGHQYNVVAKISAPALDSMGFIADFSDIKKLLKTWIDDNLDHTCILGIEDKPLGNFLENYTGQKVYFLSETENIKPTAENISLHLFEIFVKKLENFNSDEKCQIKHESTCKNTALANNACVQDADTKIQTNKQEVDNKIQPSVFDANIEFSNVFDASDKYNHASTLVFPHKLSLRSIKVSETPTSSAIIEI